MPAIFNSGDNTVGVIENNPHPAPTSTNTDLNQQMTKKGSI